jgi:hypothetical protein
MDELKNKLRAAISETPILIHSPPDIPKDAEIMGVCALSDNLAGTDQYAWIGVDFLRWKTLFHGVGKAAFQVSVARWCIIWLHLANPLCIALV